MFKWLGSIILSRLQHQSERLLRSVFGICYELFEQKFLICSLAWMVCKKAVLFLAELRRQNWTFLPGPLCEQRDAAPSWFWVPRNAWVWFIEKDLLLPAGKTKKVGIPNIIFYIVCSTDIKHIHDTQTQI